MGVTNKNHKWAKSMKKILINLNKVVTENGGKLNIDEEKKKIKRYHEILKKGQLECPIYLPTIGSKKRGKVKQTKERNLLERLINYEDEVLLFVRDPHFN